jgi:hypothetical protein
MKTQTTTQKNYYYDWKCEEHYFDPAKPGDYDAAIECDGNIDSTTGICKKCGQQGRRFEYTTEHGIVWYQVSARNHDKTVQFSCIVDGEINDEEYNRKLVSALRRIGCRLNGVWFDGCKNPDGYDGHYGYYLNNKKGGGFSVNGKFSIERI